MKIRGNSTTAKWRTQPHFSDGISIWCPLQNEKPAKLFLQERLQKLAKITLQKSTMANFCILQGLNMFHSKIFKNQLPKPLHCAGKTKGLQNQKASKSIHKRNQGISRACKIRNLPQNQDLGLAKCRTCHKATRWQDHGPKIPRLARASKQTKTIATCKTFHRMRTVALKSFFWPKS